jgi:hypothetical protein
LGGIEAAEEFFRIAEELDSAQILSPDRLAQLQRQTAAHRATGEIGRRWLSLEDQISRRQFMGA